MRRQSSPHIWNNEPPPNLMCPPGTYLTFDGERYTCQPLAERGVDSLSRRVSTIVGIVLILFSIGTLCYLVFVMPHP